jgi:spermidine/putrescine transport system permease protein
VASEDVSDPDGVRVVRRETGGAREGFRLSTFALLSPSLAYVGLFFLVPVAMVAAYSVGALTLFAGDDYLSLSSWRYFLGGSVYMGLFWKSVRMSLTVSVVVVVLAYPLAYYLALGVRKRKYLLLLVLIAPFLTSYLLRVLAWKLLLGDQGAINTLLYSTGMRTAGDAVPWLLYSQFTVMLVLAYVWVPFVALPIFVTIENIDRALLESASDLGAGKWTAFWRVTLPLSIPGVVAAFVFVFIPTIGEYITPLLVGGTRGFMYGNAIADLFGPGFDWQMGSVLAIFLLCVVAALLAVSARFMNVRTALGR